jgi:hypothetical protein
MRFEIPIHQNLYNALLYGIQSLSEKSLCGPSPSEIGAAKAPETALSFAIRRCRATQDTSIAAGQSPERAFRRDSQRRQMSIRVLSPWSAIIVFPRHEWINSSQTPSHTLDTALDTRPLRSDNRYG